jgi:hypothetical protein
VFGSLSPAGAGAIRYTESLAFLSRVTGHARVRTLERSHCATRGIPNFRNLHCAALSRAPSTRPVLPAVSAVGGDASGQQQDAYEKTRDRCISADLRTTSNCVHLSPPCGVVELPYVLQPLSVAFMLNGYAVG